MRSIFKLYEKSNEIGMNLQASDRAFAGGLEVWRSRGQRAVPKSRNDVESHMVGLEVSDHLISWLIPP